MATRPVNFSVHEGKKLTTISKVTSTNPLAIEGVDYLEIISGNARQACHYYCHTFGFVPVAYRGPETGYPEAATYVVRQEHITFLLTTPLRSKHWLSAYLTKHGDTVQSIALRVPDCEAFYLEAMNRGARSAEEPTEWRDDYGSIKRAAIHTYGDTIHPIIERKSYTGLFFPGFLPYESYFPKIPAQKNVGLQAIDHIVGNVELGKMNAWVKFYEKILGFTELQHFSDQDISTEYSALMSKVMTDGKKIKLPINEPAKGKRKSQIDEYLEFHEGPGVQHVAMITDNIVATVSELRSRGVPFLYVPSTYYDDLATRIGTIRENFEQIQSLGILVDRDEDGYLLQLFTKPVQDRPTLFFEIIQRRGSRGFGVGNFKALFESIEREQALRGNL